MSKIHLNQIYGLTVTLAELNRLSGLTANANDLNTIAGLTVSAADLNQVTTLLSDFTSHLTEDLLTAHPIASVNGDTLIQVNSLSRNRLSFNVTVPSDLTPLTDDISDLQNDVATNTANITNIMSVIAPGISGDVADAVADMIAHLEDTADAHNATAISYVGSRPLAVDTGATDTFVTVGTFEELLTFRVDDIIEVQDNLTAASTPRTITSLDYDNLRLNLDGQIGDIYEVAAEAVIRNLTVDDVQVALARAELAAIDASVGLVQDRSAKLIEGGEWTNSAASSSAATGISQASGGTDWSVAVNTGSELGQTFTPAEDFEVTQVSLAIKKSGAPTSLLQVELYATAAGVPTGAPLGTSTNTVDMTTVTTSFANYNFDFSNIALLNATQYALVLTEETPGGSGSMYLNVDTANPYAGGNLIFHNGPGSFVQNASNDAVFSISGEVNNPPSLSFTKDAYIRIPSLTDGRNTIPSSESPIFLPNEGDVAYVDINREPGVDTNLSVTVAAVDDVVHHSDRIIIAQRTSQGILAGNDAVLITEGVTTKLNLGGDPVAAHQDRNLKLIEGGEWAVAAGTKDYAVTFDAEAYIQVPGFANDRNTIQLAQSGFELDEGEVAYVDINRRTDAITNLTVNVVAISAMTFAPDRVVIARAVSDGVIVGTGSSKLRVGEKGRLDGSLPFSPVTIGPVGSGADYETDGTDDEVQFDAAVADFRLANGGEILIFEGTYNFSNNHNFAQVGISYKGSGSGTIINLPGAATLSSGTATVNIHNMVINTTSGGTIASDTTGDLRAERCTFGPADDHTLTLAGYSIFDICTLADVTASADVSFFRSDVNDITCFGESFFKESTVNALTLDDGSSLRASSSDITTITLAANLDNKLTLLDCVIGSFTQAAAETSTDSIIIGCTITSQSIPGFITGNFKGNLPDSVDTAGAGNALDSKIRFQQFLDDSDYTYGYVVDTQQKNPPLEDSIDEFVTTGSFNILDKVYDLDSGEILRTNNLTEHSLVPETTKFDSVVINSFWKTKDINAIHRVSRMGGMINSFQEVSMDSLQGDVLTGEHKFSTEMSYLDYQTQAGNTQPLIDLDDGTVRRTVSQPFIVSGAQRNVKDIEVFLTRTGTPSGKFNIALVANNAGDPDPQNVIAHRGYSSVTDIGLTETSIKLEVDTTIAIGTYHILVMTDQAYKDSYVDGVTEIAISNDIDAGLPDIQTFDGSTYTTLGSNETFKFTIRTQSAISQLVSEQNLGGADFPTVFDDGTATAKMAQPFTLTKASQGLYLYYILQKTGTPSGTITVSVVKDSAGEPNFDELLFSTTHDVTALNAGNNFPVIAMPEIPMLPDTYHVVWETDAAYQASYLAGNDEIGLGAKSTGPTGTGVGTALLYDGADWSTTTEAFVYSVYGRVLDLILEIESTSDGAQLAAFGLGYIEKSGIVDTDETFLVNRRVDAPDAGEVRFDLSSLAPLSPVFLEAKFSGGQAATAMNKDFTIDGTEAVFAAGTFDLDPSNFPIYITFTQYTPNKIADINRSVLDLLARNHMPNDVDGAINFGYNGRGYKFYDDDGVLVELQISGDSGSGRTLRIVEV